MSLTPKLFANYFFSHPIYGFCRYLCQNISTVAHNFVFFHGNQAIFCGWYLWKIVFWSKRQKVLPKRVLYLLDENFTKKVKGTCFFFMSILSRYLYRYFSICWKVNLITAVSIFLQIWWDLLLSNSQCPS